jgi:hypothetical protein
MKNFGKIFGVVSAGVIASVLPTCYASAYSVVYTTDYLRVREAPSLDAAIIDVVSPGTAIQQIQELDNGWSEVLYNGSVYYMFSYYLTSGFEDEEENESYYEEDIEDVVYDNDYDEYTYTDEIISASDFRFNGEKFWGDYRWTYYSEKVLPGGGLDIPGRHTDYNGYVCDENDYICLASDFLDKGTVVSTPFGKDGKVYDCGCGDNITLDVYVNW